VIFVESPRVVVLGDGVLGVVIAEVGVVWSLARGAAAAQPPRTVAPMTRHRTVRTLQRRCAKGTPIEGMQ